MTDSWWRRTLRSLAGPDPVVAEGHRREVAALQHRATVQVAAAHTQRDRVLRAFDASTAEYAAAVAAQEAEHARTVAALEDIIDVSERAHLAAAARLEALVDVEPPPVDGCHKIRLRDVGEARVMIRKLAAETGRSEVEFDTYGCKVCPRHPLTCQRFLHVCNAVTAERTGRGGASWRAGQRVTTGYARHEGRLVEQRIDPGVAARLRSIGGGEAS